jgi:serine O-acetyltransferase
MGNPDKPTGKTPPIMEKFCQSLPEVRELLRADIAAAYEGDPAAQCPEEIILSYPFIEAISIQRLAHRLHRFGAPLIPRMMTEWAHSRTGIDIHPGASIGSHFFIDHGTGVVVGETCRIGNHVKLYHGVTLGARSFAKDESGHVVKGGKRHPDVEDNVTIYPNSTILGGETVIGANSTIGANVFLMHSVPPNSLVVYEEKQLSTRDKTVHRKLEDGEMRFDGLSVLGIKP